MRRPLPIAVVIAAVVIGALLLLAALVLRLVRPPRATVVRLISAQELEERGGARFAAYFAGFSAADAAARGGCRGPSACRQAYFAAIVPPAEVPSSTLKALHLAVAEARRLCAERAPRLLKADAWRVAFLREGAAAAENGWPHTHGDVVCLPSDFFASGGRDFRAQVETLVHEQVHVYQRRFPREAGELVRAWGYRPAEPRYQAPLKRSNPDLDGVEYADTRGVVTLQLYRSARPSSLADSAPAAFRYSAEEGRWRPLKDAMGGQEHPWERMAYEVARCVVNDDDGRDRDREAAAWMARLA